MSEDSDHSSRYGEIIVAVFERLVQQYGVDATRLPFDKDFLDQLANELRIKNIPDIIYSYRSGRRDFPKAMLLQTHWVIVGEGKGKYAFVSLDTGTELIMPNDLEITPIPDATPEVVLKFAKGDEQSMLAQVRYNRLIDIFTGLTTYHLQSHLRAYVHDMGQVEVDDLYLGVNTNGQWFCIPVEAKSGGAKDQLGRIQISSLVAYAEQEFAGLPVRPVGIKMVRDGSMFFVEFTATSDPLRIQSRFYKRYLLTRSAAG